jgi:circadian clock protein KaiC
MPPAKKTAKPAKKAESPFQRYQPPEKPRSIVRKPTGIADFDKLVQGGLIEGSTNLIAGTAGSGKTIFAMEYLIKGIEKCGEAGMYLTFEERKESLYEDMYEFGWDLAKLEREGKFVFLRYKPAQIMNIINEGGGVIETIIHESKIKRLVIDSITSFTLLYKDELAKKEAALALFELIAKWGVTCLLTSEDESPYEKTIVASLEFEVDGIILAYHIKRKGVRTRALEIVKMRGTNHSQSTMQLEISKDGIRIRADKIVNIDSHI